MAIKSHTGPADGRAVMEAALSTRTPNRMRFTTPLGGAPQSASPVPFFHLSIDQLAGVDPLGTATMTGWRYPIVGGIKPGLADVRGPTGGGAGSQFGGLSHGLMAQRFLEAAILAEQQLGDSAEVYQPRLLDVPALQYAALWLESPTGRRFVPLLEGRPAGTAPLKLVDDIVTDLRSRASARAQQTATPAPGTPAPTTPEN